MKLKPLALSVLARPSIAVEAMADANVREGLKRSLIQHRSQSGRFARLAVRQASALRGRPFNLIEEGLVHEIWRAIYRAEDKPSDSWLPFMPHIGPNIILLDVAPQEALRRVLTKKSLGPVNRELADADIDQAQWRRANAAYELLRQEIARTPGVVLNVIKVDDLSPAEVSEEIIRIVHGRS